MTFGTHTQVQEWSTNNQITNLSDWLVIYDHSDYWFVIWIATVDPRIVKVIKPCETVHLQKCIFRSSLGKNIRNIFSRGAENPYIFSSAQISHFQGLEFLSFLIFMVFFSSKFFICTKNVRPLRSRKLPRHLRRDAKMSFNLPCP